MNLKALQRMSLGDSKSKEKDTGKINSSAKSIFEKKTKPNDEFERYITYASEEDCSPYNPPVLHIVDKSKTIEITLSVCRNAFVRATIENKTTHYKQTGCSTGNITETFNEIESDPKLHREELSYRKDVLFCGFICEALCRAGIRLDPVVADMDILKEFVDDSISFCFPELPDIFGFDITKLQSDFEVQESIPDYEKQIFSKFILPNKAIIKIAACDLYIQISDSKVYQIKRPVFLRSDCLQFADIDIAAIWILLEYIGFHVKESLCYSKGDTDFQIPTFEFDDAQIISPSDIRGELYYVKA